MRKKVPESLSCIAVMAFILTGCEASSTKTPAQEILVDADLVVDGANDTMELEVYLSVRRSTVSVPLVLEGGDSLALEQGIQSSSLVENSENRRYRVTVSPVSNDPYTLVFNHVSHGESIRSILSVPFSILAFSAEILNGTDRSVLSYWDVGGPGGIVDTVNFPTSASLVSTPVSCIDSYGAEVVIDSGVTRSFKELNKDDIISGEAITSVEEVVRSNSYLSDDLSYISCSFDIQLIATWSNSWDGESELVGLNGPVWIRPSAIFANEVLPLQDQEYFDITVYSGSQNLVITCLSLPNIQSLQ